jgi:crotonobetainyl-CoA:carnitine CoA-transferase CaiB-like acyl-CoA transferase
VSHKGFLPGPYEHRTALDEVVQMMGGLAYMTGPEGRPLRAGTSVNDIMGGMFGAIGVLAALRRSATPADRPRQEVQSALFENNVLLVAQHMMQFAVTGQAGRADAQPHQAWAVYDVFTVADGEQIFLAAVSDTQWALLCREFGFADLAADAAPGQQQRPGARARLDDAAAARALRGLQRRRTGARFERWACPTHRSPGRRTCSTTRTWRPPAGWRRSPAGRRQRRRHAVHTRMPLLPLALDGQRLPLRLDPPRWASIRRCCCASWATADGEIQALRDAGVLHG